MALGRAGGGRNPVRRHARAARHLHVGRGRVCLPGPLARARGTLLGCFAPAHPPFHAASGLAALGLLALAPAYWEHTTFFLTEIPLIVFFTAAIFLFYQGPDDGPPSCLYASWVCEALGLLTRYSSPDRLMDPPSTRSVVLHGELSSARVARPSSGQVEQSPPKPATTRQRS